MTFVIQNRDQSVKAIRKRFQFNTPNIAAGFRAGTLPAGALLLSVRVHIIVPFNAGASDLLSSGVGPSNAEFMINADLSGAANAIIDQTGRAVQEIELAGLPNPVGVFIQYQQTGGVATAGDALFVLEYLEPETLTVL